MRQFGRGQVTSTPPPLRALLRRKHPPHHLCVQRVSNYTYPAAALFHLSPSLMPAATHPTDRPARSSAPARRIEAPDTILVAVRARAPAAGLADGAAAASSGVGCTTPRRPPSCGGRRGSCASACAGCGTSTTRTAWATGGSATGAQGAAGGRGSGAVGGAVERAGGARCQRMCSGLKAKCVCMYVCRHRV